MSNPVMVLGALEEGRPTRRTLEVLNAARRAATSVQSPVHVVLPGFGIGNGGADLGMYGVAAVWRVEHPLLARYDADAYAEGLRAVIARANPQVVLLSADAAGRDLAPRLAYRLGGSLVTEAIDTRVEDGRIAFLKPVFGGKALAWMLPRRGVPVVTLKLRAFDPATAAGSGAAEFHDVRVDLPEALQASRVVDSIREATGGLKLEDARVVVAGGRGLGGPTAFEDLKRLADLLGGAVAASRAACDAGWVPASWQVGQTGKVIAPDLYIAIGISGASQHLAGINNAKHVVAINTDPDAPIFKRATTGIVADYRTVLPALIAQLRAELGR